ncbi:hypothetical protein EV132_102533 [Rhizobium sullae]|uniref:Uncharacterized protein n=1 Tax=Rhizobium sullae TaxID=50338 RepID=A0A4R3QHR6_RHISU|nr:hypothetical protein EV132_102533 [Rhizobium sullae]
MPIKKDDTGNHWVEMELIVPGTPEGGHRDRPRRAKKIEVRWRTWSEETFRRAGGRKCVRSGQ